MTELVKAHLDHRRTWQSFDYCYPVISRRSRGVSLGVNLDPTKLCNFNCVYCEVDRRTPPRVDHVDVDRLMAELEALVDLTLDGRLFEHEPFSSAPQRRFNDIAFSGDGEPTTAREFPEVVSRIAELRRRRNLEDVKVVLITNGSRLTVPEVAAALDELMANGGEIWAKLDAGTEAHYRDINRSKVPFSRILQNLTEASQRWPITLQTLLLEWRGNGPPDGELSAYLACLQGILEAGGRLQGIQLYTIARPTPEALARPLPDEVMDAIAAKVKDALPHLPVHVFYGPHAPSLA